MDENLITIIVPIYNAEKYLSRCIDSILSQTFKHFDALLINDGSSDRSRKICEEYARKDNRIKVFHKNNGGVSSARNLGLNNTFSKWVTFIDSDDWISTSYLEDLITSAQETDPDIVIESPIYVYKDKHKTIKIQNKLYTEEVGLRDLILNGLLDFTEPHSKLFKVDIIKKYKIYFPENVKIGEDGIFNAMFLNVSSRFLILNKTGYYYNKTSESAQSNYYVPEVEIKGIKLWKPYLLQLSQKANLPQNNAAIWRILSSIIFRYLNAVSKNKNLSIKEKISWINKLDNDCFLNYGIGRTSTLKGKLLKLLINKQYKYLFILLLKYNK